MNDDKKINHYHKLSLTREREALFANLRSEFSTPLDAIVGYTQILIDELEFYQLGKYANDLNKILNSGKLLQNRVDEVLSITNIKKRKNIDMKTFDLKLFSSDLQFNLLTPLNSIINYCELILEDKLSIEQAQFINDIEKIIKSAKLFVDYINEIDNLAKIQWGGLDLLSHFKKSKIIIHDVITSIPPLEKKILYAPKAFKGSILVVDDNEMARNLLMRLVMHYGFDATPCGDASQVLDKIDIGNFDLILLPIIMSGASGFEVLKRIKEHRLYYYLPVIVISPLKEIDAVVRCIEMGADDYLLKPFNPVIFKARIESSIEKKILRDEEELHLKQLKEEKSKSDNLLLNIVPSAIADRLKLGEKTIVERFPEITVIFIDIVNFSYLADKLTPNELIRMLNTVFSNMDELTDQFGLEKIKTIGDCYMAVAGAPIHTSFHAEMVADFACSVLDEMAMMNEGSPYPIQIRIGIHTGPVVAGVIGKKKFNYDLWGKTVNLASRMESHGEPDKIHVSESTYEILKDLFVFKKREEIVVKGMGKMTTYFLIKRKPSYKASGIK